MFIPIHLNNTGQVFDVVKYGELSLLKKLFYGNTEVSSVSLDEELDEKIEDLEDLNRGSEYEFNVDDAKKEFREQLANLKTESFSDLDKIVQIDKKIPILVDKMNFTIKDIANTDKRNKLLSMGEETVAYERLTTPSEKISLDELEDKIKDTGFNTQFDELYDTVLDDMEVDEENNKISFSDIPFTRRVLERYKPSKLWIDDYLNQHKQLSPNIFEETVVLATLKVVNGELVVEGNLDEDQVEEYFDYEEVETGEFAIEVLVATLKENLNRKAWADLFLSAIFDNQKNNFIDYLTDFTKLMQVECTIKPKSEVSPRTGEVQIVADLVFTEYGRIRFTKPPLPRLAGATKKDNLLKPRVSTNIPFPDFIDKDRINLKQPDAWKDELSASARAKYQDLTPKARQTREEELRDKIFNQNQQKITETREKVLAFFYEIISNLSDLEDALEV
tara:strand:+ start:18984 stop:20324 length:1341 start_codon:yes stop_codon:yes gene_type:complete